ncbi:glycosyl hydrolase [Haladaptatus sp. R4]|uniref:ThuA domain-containing protein n=1 Tax=Haladaptatus sp. R4 TaxID=1679489 RepID=UPI0007B49ACC|nr:glycosyl hydrolase [Haladaptatus sp. R4]
MKIIDSILIGENTFPFHSLDDFGNQIDVALGSMITVDVTTDRTRFERLSDYDIVIDYLTDSTLTDEQFTGLQSFVAEGNGYLGIHCAADLTSVSDGNGGIDARSEPIPELRELLRGHFVDHPVQSNFEVDVQPVSHPVINGVSDFEVFDEPYQVDCDEDEVTVLARMEHPDLESYPVLWVRRYGDGRVCYVSLGHTADAFEHEGFRRILQNAARWVADA